MSLANPAQRPQMPTTETAIPAPYQQPGPRYGVRVGLAPQTNQHGQHGQTNHDNAPVETSALAADELAADELAADELAADELAADELAADTDVALLFLSAPAEWRTQALRLCDRTDLKYTPHHHSFEAVSRVETWRVPTRDRQGPDHTVRYECAVGHLHCDCVAGSHGRACCHVGAVLYWMASYDDAYRTASADVSETDAYDAAFWGWAAEQPEWQAIATPKTGPKTGGRP